MRNPIELEEKRLERVSTLADYEMLHERHRIFPDAFEDRRHRRVLDIAAGVGVVGERIQRLYGHAELLCNDISPTCLGALRELGIATTSFDIDSPDAAFPLKDESFDAVIALATIEHVYNVDHFVKEVRRILAPEGCFYVSAPNYSGLLYLGPLLLTGKTFHDPMAARSRYEFYAHLRYFTYRTLVEYVSSFGFTADAVYLGLPDGSSRFLRLKERSRLRAWGFRGAMRLLYSGLSPRWASEPVICFRRSGDGGSVRPRKVVL